MKDFDTELALARKRVENMDRIDGFKDRYLVTILAALEAGIKHADSGSSYDALVMLQDVVKSGTASIRP